MRLAYLSYKFQQLCSPQQLHRYLRSATPAIKMNFKFKICNDIYVQIKITYRIKSQDIDDTVWFDV